MQNEVKTTMTSTLTPLFTDLYQLTMAYGYYQLHMHEQRANFQILFRKNPFKGNFALCAGLANVIDFLNHWRFQEDDLTYLSTLKNPAQEPLFSPEFLDYLKQLKFNCDIYAIPEGTVVFPHTPLLRIEGPLLQCQLLETPILNIINFQTLIATKASRVCRAAQGEEVIEFGMRRAQGPDGALSASRAAYIGGASSTSNTLAGKLYDIPVRGTHAHSWVTAFKDELTAFKAYATVMPHNGIYLVDTYQTLNGVKNAIQIGKQLQNEGDELLAIRLDSGDMAKLSIEARKLLDEAGFKQTKILASNSLDEYAITHLKQQGATISAWGVGTALATAYDHPALDGVYKLSAIQNENKEWEYKLKVSEDSIKTSNPGRHQVRRFFYNEQYMMDVIYDIDLGISDIGEAILIDQPKQIKKWDDVDAYVDLLQPIFKAGELITPLPSIHEIRQNAIREITHFYETHDDQIYPVGLEKNLHELKQKIVETLHT